MWVFYRPTHDVPLSNDSKAEGPARARVKAAKVARLAGERSTAAKAPRRVAVVIR